MPFMKRIFAAFSLHHILNLVLFCLLAFFVFLFSSRVQAQNKKIFRLWTPAFENGEKIPIQFTCDGRNVSPPLFWENAPAHTSYFTLTVNDPDAPAGNWVHWRILRIPGSFQGLPCGISRQGARKSGIQEGRNTWGTIGYRGPCPPGGTHRYFFTLKAYSKNGLEIGKAVLMGMYR